MAEFAVIFDMDGVIVHTNPFHEIAFKTFFDKYGVPYTDADFAEHMYGKHNSYILSHYFKRPIQGEELRAMEEEKESLFREIYRNQVDAIPGFLSFHAELMNTGVPIGVATSAPRANMQLVLDSLGIQDTWSSLMASEDVTHHKPHPEIYQQSALNVGMIAEQCVVFEDSFSGVTAAKQAGAKVVGVLSSHTVEELPPCDYYIENYEQLTIDQIRLLI